MYVLGIDPGFANIGWAFARKDKRVAEVLALGVIRTEKKQGVGSTHDNLVRLSRIARELRELRSAWECAYPSSPIEGVAVEAMSYVRSSTSSAKVMMVWGVLIAYADTWGAELRQMSAKDVKRACGIRANAGKDAVAAACARLVSGDAHGMLTSGCFGRPPIPKRLHEHAFDALAMAVTWGGCAPRSI